jgi:hypothetical protein
MSLIDRLEDEAKLLRPQPFKGFSQQFSFTSGRSNARKRPSIVRRKWLGTYLVQLEHFEGRNNVIVYNESTGYDKVVAKRTGLERAEADRVFDLAALIVREEI